MEPTSNRRDAFLRLLTSASCLRPGHDPRCLVDEDGDIQLSDAPFGIWVRLMMTPEGEPKVVLLASPLIELQVTEELLEQVKHLLSDRPVIVQLGAESIQLFCVAPDSVLDDYEQFQREVAAISALGDRVIVAVQPAHGGLTGEQHRALAGWRGSDDAIEATVSAVAAEVGAQCFRHGWNPRAESVPLLVSEERIEAGWIKRFVTVDTSGLVRLRTTTPEVRDGVRGNVFAISWVAEEPARAWARGLGVADGQGPLTSRNIGSLAGRTWQELTDTLRGVPHQVAESWEREVEA